MADLFSYLSIVNPGYPAASGTSSPLPGGTFAYVSILNSIPTSSGVTAGGSLFANANGVSFGSSGSTVTASVDTGWLPVASSTAFLPTSGNLALTNLTGTLGSDGISLSAAAPGGGGAVMVSAGTTSGNVQTLAFLNSNGISFGLSGSTITGTVGTNYQSAGAYLTTAALSQDSSKYAGTNGAITNGSITVNTSGVSVNVKNSSLNELLAPNADASWFMNTRQFQMQWGTNVTGFTTAVARQGLFELDFAGSNFTDAGANLDVLHVHASTGDPPIDIAHLEANGTLATALRLHVGGSVAAEINKPIKFTHSVSTALIGSVPMILPTQMSNSVANLNANFLQGKASSDFQSVGAYLTTADLSQNSSRYAGTAGAITGGSITVNTSGVSVNLPAYLTTADLSQNSSKYAGINGAITGGSITVNTSGVSVNIPLQGTISNLYWPQMQFNSIGTMVNGSLSCQFVGVDQPLSVSMADVYFSHAGATAANNSSAGIKFSAWLGWYSRTGLTLNSKTTTSLTFSTWYSSNNTGSVFGMRAFDIPININAAAGEYIVGVILSTATSGQTSLAQTLTMYGGTDIGSNNNAVTFGQSNTNKSQGYAPGLGMFSVTTGGLPNAISLSDLAATGTGIQSANLKLDFRNY